MRIKLFLPLLILALMVSMIHLAEAGCILDVSIPEEVKVGQRISVFLIHNHEVEVKMWMNSEIVYSGILRPRVYGNYLVYVPSEVGIFIITVNCTCGESFFDGEVIVRYYDALHLHLIGPRMVKFDTEFNLTIVHFIDGVKFESLEGHRLLVYRVYAGIPDSWIMILNVTTNYEGVMTFTTGGIKSACIYYVYCIECDNWGGVYVTCGEYYYPPEEGVCCAEYYEQGEYLG